ncbi:MAG: hypothetical protein JWL79_988 [Frankiales bacterium]|nr:hypothetical protein [Frankiales bacterium]
MAGRARLLAGLAVLVAAGLAGGGAYALSQATGDSTPTAQTTPSAEPVVTPSESPAPVPTTATPTSTPTSTVSATATATPTVSTSPTPRRYPYPSPTKGYRGLALTASMNTPRGTVGQSFTLQGHATDGDGTIFVTSVDWGDGTVDGGEPSPTSCPAYPSPSANPGPYQPEPDSRSFARSHAYANPGDYKVVVTVRSVNADCHPHGPIAETLSLAFTGANRIHVVTS